MEIGGIDSDIYPYLFREEDICPYCGSIFNYVFKKNILTITECGSEFITAKPQFHLKCPYSSKIPNTENIINIEIGNLIFSNHFGKEVPNHPSSEFMDINYSINYNFGRRNIAKYLAKQNIGYGQMSNTSINIWVNDNLEDIILSKIEDYSDRFLEDYTREEIDPHELDEAKWVHQMKQKGYTYKGKIDCGTRRWMCSDISNLPPLLQCSRRGYLFT